MSTDIFITYLISNCLRFAKFQDMSAKGVIEPSKLPPTESSSAEHSLRAHFQCLVWKSLKQMPKDPTNFGWKDEDGAYIPITSKQICAPDDLLKFIRCKCKAGCISNLCSCKKHGLVCVPACKHCHSDCKNGQVSYYRQQIIINSAFRT